MSFDSKQDAREQLAIQVGEAIAAAELGGLTPSEIAQIATDALTIRPGYPTHLVCFEVSDG
jgi:hypothetical protein